MGGWQAGGPRRPGAPKKTQSTGSPRRVGPLLRSPTNRTRARLGRRRLGRFRRLTTSYVRRPRPHPSFNEARLTFEQPRYDLLDCSQMLIAAVDRVAVDLLELGGVEVVGVERRDVLLELRDAAGARAAPR